MPTAQQKNIADIREHAANGCPQCQNEHAQLLALTTIEYGLPDMMKGLPPPANNATPSVAQHFADALDQARHGRYGQAAQHLQHAALALTRSMSNDTVQSDNRAWPALIALQQTVMALGPLHDRPQDIQDSVDISSRLLATEPHLTARALVFLDRTCTHQPTSATA